MSNNPEQTQAWQNLAAHQKTLQALHMRDLFAEDPERFNRFHIICDGLIFDYSKHKITDETVSLLSALARDCSVKEKTDDLFAGKPVNKSEKRPALHMALRGSAGPDLDIDGENISRFVEDCRARIKVVSDRVRSEKKFSAVVNIGIGGSDLGPKMVCAALKNISDGPDVYFISSIDGDALSLLLEKLEPEETLFIVASKTFSTLETLANARAAKSWIEKARGENASAKHFIGVTSNKDAALEFGIHEDNILPMRPWMGGRYSLWSAIGLPVAIAAGYENFEKLLNGAQAMDAHFKTAAPERNIPVVMGLLGIWYRNFWEYHTHAVLPYTKRLQDFPVYIQQLDMESNGKSADRNGKAVSHATGPIVFGGTGTDCQHAFFQFLHQGSDIVPCDFIIAAKAQHDFNDHHTALISNALAQSKALMEGMPNKAEPHRHFEGNRPGSTIILDSLSPHNLGMLLAAYEHKIFVQSAIWNINAFDQWGVELGKNIAKNISNMLETGKNIEKTDSSTQNLLKIIRKKI